jgi:superfamily II DNA or RNA helicase
MIIEIGNSYSKIQGMTPQEEKILRKELSYTIGGSSSYFSGFQPKKRSLLSKTGEFPSGLIDRVLDVFPAAKISPVVSAVPYIGLSNLTFTIKGAYEWQLKAADAAIGKHRGTISAVTGSGKSLVIALLAGRLDLPTLVIVPSLEIKKQLTMSLLNVLGLNHKVTVENIDSRVLWTSKKHYDCLIIDEAHHAAAKTYQKLNKERWNDIYYRFFLTATPFRNDKEETLLFEAIAGEVIYSLSYKQALKDNLIVPINAYYIDLPKKKVSGDTWVEVYKELVVNNSSRNELICTLLHTLDVQNKSALCLVKEVQHGKNIDYPNFIHGEDEDSRIYIEYFNNRSINCLIGTEGVMGEGIDSKPCEFVIVAGLGKAKSAFMQKIGRGLRKYPGKESCTVVIFRDRSHKYTLRHFNEQKKILIDEYGVTVVKLNL